MGESAINGVFPHVPGAGFNVREPANLPGRGHPNPDPPPPPLEERFDHFLEVLFTPGPQNFVGNIALLVNDEGQGHQFHAAVGFAHRVISLQHRVSQVQLRHDLLQLVGGGGQADPQGLEALPLEFLVASGSDAAFPPGTDRKKR